MCVRGNPRRRCRRPRRPPAKTPLVPSTLVPPSDQATHAFLPSVTYNSPHYSPKRERRPHSGMPAACVTPGVITNAPQRLRNLIIFQMLGSGPRQRPGPATDARQGLGGRHRAPKTKAPKRPSSVGLATQERWDIELIVIHSFMDRCRPAMQVKPLRGRRRRPPPGVFRYRFWRPRRSALR